MPARDPSGDDRTLRNALDAIPRGKARQRESMRLADIAYAALFPLSFTLDGLSVTLESAPVIITHPSDSDRRMLRLPWVTATQGGSHLFADEMQWDFAPLLAKDGTWRDIDETIDGRTVTTRRDNVVEDPVLALQQQIVRAILIATRQGPHTGRRR